MGQAILLHMIASLEEDASGKPNRAAIYDSLFSQLVDRTWSDQGQISILKDIGLDKKMLRYALQDIAHAIFMSGKGYLRRADLEKLPKVKTIQDKLKQNNRGVELWRTVMIAAYLDEKKKNKEDQDDQEQAAYGIEFLHKSLYEYLCAEKMWRDICNGFLSRDRENEWSIMEGKVALDLASKVFSAQSISQEVNDYLIEIIANHNSLEDKQMLSQRMGLFLPYCLERNFLHKFDSDLEKEPFSKATSVFIGYWSILINLDQKKNYFPFPYRAQNFINMCFSYFFEIKFIRRMNFSFQDFSDLNMARIVLIESDLSKSNLSNSNLNMAILYRVILKEANLKGAFFFRTRLDGANMIDSKLEGAFMKEADLLQVNLAGADLRNAELIGANLSGAILFRSNLANANLTGANLQDANLIGANFENADLSDVDMTRANLEGANFNFKQLSQVKSLFSAKNIPKELFNQIKSKKPHLLELPKGRGR